MNDNLRRLLAPRQLVVVGGAAAEAAIRSCRAIGYAGDIWAVSQKRATLAGVESVADIADLPGVPDAAFVAVSRERTVDVVGQLARLGAGGAVCHASGFAEDGPYGAGLQRDLIAAAGEMALIGPNCLGLLNYLDGAALWPEQHGGTRVGRGVAIISQSGNIGQNLTMQQRALPLAQLVTVGNGAVTGVCQLVEAMLADPRISAIGLHLEDVPDVAELSRVTAEALRRKVPIVVLKSGSSELGTQVALSHTSALAGSDVLCDALFRRLGIARVHQVSTFVETLKLLHTLGALPGARIASASCSGGEAAHVADRAAERGVTMPELPVSTADRLHAVLGDRVSVRNPLDYHTYIWGQRDAMTECFSAFLGSGVDCHLLVLDYPRADRCDIAEFDLTVEAFVDAHRGSAARACVVSSLPESLPEELGHRLMAAGIAPMQGISDCLAAISAARDVGLAQAAYAEAGAAASSVGLLAAAPPLLVSVGERVEQLDEVAAKTSLRSFGVSVPAGAVGGEAEVAGLAAGLGFPVVVKAVSSTLAHKSDVGAVQVGLTSAAEVAAAAAGMQHLADEFLVEQMVLGASVELIVGVRRDPQFGLALTVGAGGVLVELLRDTVTVLLPATSADIRGALGRLRIWPLLQGFRGGTSSVEVVERAVSCLVEYALHHADRLVELEVNPMLVLPDRVVAVDALIRMTAPGRDQAADPAGVPHPALEEVQ